MAITKTNNEIIYTEPEHKELTERTGVVVDSEFAIADATNIVKQIKFNITPTTAAAGIATINVDIASDATLNLTGIPTGATPYTPAVSGDWDGTAPTTIKAAIDRLAALIKTLNGGTGA